MIKTMIIEDDPMVRMIIGEFVDKVGGFKVLSLASDIDEAKIFLEDNEFDLILLDVFLPSGSGIDLLKWIREKEVETDVILITAENNKASIKEAFRYGAIDYLVKPFVFERFKDSLQNFKVRYDDFKGEDYIGQEYIDQYITGINGPKDILIQKTSENTISLTSGLNINTYNKVYKNLNMQECEVTAEFIASEAGLARVTVRRYLDFMVKEGSVKLIQSYGKIGRPTHFYKINK